jgi:hypothetical protein
VDFRAVLDAVVDRKITSPRCESNPRTPIVQLVAQDIMKNDLMETGCEVIDSLRLVQY